MQADPVIPTSHSGLATVAAAAGRFALVSTDVFDTLLLRTNRSERSRIIRGERRFAEELSKRGLNVSVDMLVEARLAAQKLAFRALDVSSQRGEVRLTDVLRRQMLLCGLSPEQADRRLTIELEIEKESLRPNHKLVAALKKHRQSGARVVAISDTTLPADAVRALVDHVAGRDVVDHVYSSADERATKRDGTLFMAVLDAEKTRPADALHMGDDRKADLASPHALGIAAIHLPRAAIRSKARTANGALAEAGRVIQRKRSGSQGSGNRGVEAKAFGQHVLGPIVTQLCQRIWLYAAQAEATDRSVLMFCARGGVGIREAFEATIAKLGLPLEMRRETLMVSRLVAVRAAILKQSSAAFEELEREFKNESFASAATALGGRAFDLPPEWQAAFHGAEFSSLLTSPSGRDVLAEIEKQHQLFSEHFSALASDADRVILCDTGLYGSTQRLLAAGMPERRIETIQFARSNYKGHGEEHFPQVAGLLVERDGYHPLAVSSCVLRYWHLIERLFEPSVPSVRLFSRDDAGRVRANCGNLSHGAINATRGNPLLAGVMAYIDALPAHAAQIVDNDVALAWPRLKRAILRPNAGDIASIGSSARSIDFGRARTVEVVSLSQDRAFYKRLVSMKAQLWREGAISQEFPVLKHALLPLLDSLYSMRSLLGR